MYFDTLKYSQKSGLTFLPSLSLLQRTAILLTCVHSVVSEFATLWTLAHRTPLSMRFSRQEYWSGLPFPPLGDLSDPGIKATFPALPASFFTTEISVKPKELVHTLDKEYSKLDNKQLTQLKVDLIFF